LELRSTPNFSLKEADILMRIWSPDDIAQGPREFLFLGAGCNTDGAGKPVAKAAHWPSQGGRRRGRGRRPQDSRLAAEEVGESREAQPLWDGA
jgi:hypothetical protein